jgi:hexosaminidase
MVSLLSYSYCLQPSQFTFGSSTTAVTKFAFDSPRLKTLTKAFDRYNDLIFTHKTSSSSELSTNHTSTVVSVSVTNLSEDYPQIDTDESYTLKVPENGGKIFLTANTVYGALRGLESLSQLVLFDYDLESYSISGTPIVVEDTPRFPHRGMLLDTSRHYHPMTALKRTVDALSYAKYNVLHWHIVDTQVRIVARPWRSFPSYNINFLCAVELPIPE